MFLSRFNIKQFFLCPFVYSISFVPFIKIIKSFIYCVNSIIKFYNIYLAITQCNVQWMKLYLFYIVMWKIIRTLLWILEIWYESKYCMVVVIFSLVDNFLIMVLCHNIVNCIIFMYYGYVMWNKKNSSSPRATAV